MIFSFGKKQTYNKCVALLALMSEAKTGNLLCTCCLHIKFVVKFYSIFILNLSSETAAGLHVRESKLRSWLCSELWAFPLILLFKASNRCSAGGICSMSASCKWQHLVILLICCCWVCFTLLETHMKITCSTDHIHFTLIWDKLKRFPDFSVSQL